MKILILATKLPFPPRDGGSIATLQMLLGLYQSGNELCCLAINTSKHPFPVENIPKELQSKIRFLGVAMNTRIRPLVLLSNLLFSTKPYIAQRFHKSEYRKALRHLLQKETFHIIQFEGPYFSAYLDEVRKYSSARIVLRAHNLEHQIWHRMALNQTSPVRKWYLTSLSKRLKKYEVSLARNVDFLIPIGKNEEVFFREQGIDKPLLTIATGLNLDEYPLKSNSPFSTIFFIGALDWLPNQEGLSWFLDEVFHDLIKEAPKIHFHVAGRNVPSHFRAKLKHPQITFHGEVEDAKAFMQSNGIMIAPLFSGSGIRIKILEAMALGRPVITTTTGIEGIPYHNLPSVLVSDHPQKYKELILQLIKYPKDAGELVKEARLLISRDFDNLELCQRLHQFYKAQA